MYHDDTNEREGSELHMVSLLAALTVGQKGGQTDTQRRKKASI